MSLSRGAIITRLAAIALTVFLIPTGLSAREGGYYKYEASMGLGWATSPESDIFNVPQDEEVSNVLALNIAFRYYVTRNFALGAHMYGYYTVTDEFGVLDPNGNVVTTKFDLDTANFGLQGRYVIPRGRVWPYGFLAVNWANGSITSHAEFPGQLNYNGVSVGIGAGLGFMFGNGFMLSVEGIASFGTASWETAPFGNSSGDDFDPSHYGVLVNLSYFLGKTRETEEQPPRPSP